MSELVPSVEEREVGVWVVGVGVVAGWAGAVEAGVVERVSRRGGGDGAVVVGIAESAGGVGVGLDEC